MPTIRYEIDADSKELQDAVDAAVRKLSGLEGATKKADAAQGKLATSSKKLAMGLGMGGLAGDTEDLVEGLGGIASAGGPAAAIVAGLAIAGAAAAAGLIAVTRAGDAALDRLDKLGQADAITEDQRASIELANASLDALGVVVDTATAKLAAGLAPTVITITGRFIDFGQLVIKVSEAIADSELRVTSWGKIAAVFLLEPIRLAVNGLDALNKALGISNPGIEASAQAFEGLSERLASQAFELTKSTEATGEHEEALAGLSPEVRKLIEDLRKANDEKKHGADRSREAAKATKELEQAYRSEIDALEKIGTIGQKAGEDQLDAAQRLQVAYEDQIAQVSQLEAAAITAAQTRGASEEELTGITETAVAARADLEARYARDTTSMLAAEYAARASEVAAGEAMIAEIVAQAAQSQVVEPWEEARDQIVQSWSDLADAVEPYLEGLDKIAGGIGDIATLSADYYETQLALNTRNQKAAQKYLKSESKEVREAAEAYLKEEDKKEARYKRRILAAFRASQGVAIVQAIIAGAQSALAMIPGIALAMGPAAAGAPAVAFGIAAAATAVQVATIAAQKPPKLHTGLSSSDEYAATLAKGEGVANNTTMSDPGFRRELAARNAGMENDDDWKSARVYLNDRDLAALGDRIGRVSTPQGPSGNRSHYGR